MLFKKTKDSTYYRDALLAASYGMKKLNAPGTDVLKNENNDYNQPGFKGILVHYMAMFAKDNNLAVRGSEVDDLLQRKPFGITRGQKTQSATPITDLTNVFRKKNSEVH